ncbi:MAG: metallophosphoesterase family protein, partial [Halobacteria archaeon]|nr:metallophosphoesterase family protein [Halobacteria archaeon]
MEIHTMEVVVTSDTHLETPEGLPTPLRDFDNDTDAVVHAGDFTTRTVHDHFSQYEGYGVEFHAVHGNADDEWV